MLDDETLRDGLQSPSVSAPAIEQKLQILHLMEELGIDTANIGLPGAGAHVVRDVERLAREIAGGMKIRANCAARTVIADIRPIAEISQRTGLSIECCTFIGSSPIRQYAEGWTLDDLQRRTEEAIQFAVGEGLPVMYVTEDTTRADPETLRALYSTAIRVGASRLCVADTVGHATPAGAAAVVRFIAGVAADCGSKAGIDWHGHRDRDLAIANTIAAIDAGATRVHGAALGIGERVGNTPMDLLLVNLVLMGYVEREAASRRSRSGRCRAVRTSCTGSRSVA
jgi:2-isopropylmalate synthase